MINNIHIYRDILGKELTESRYTTRRKINKVYDLKKGDIGTISFYRKKDFSVPMMPYEKRKKPIIHRGFCFSICRDGKIEVMLLTKNDQWSQGTRTLVASNNGYSKYSGYTTGVMTPRREKIVKEYLKKYIDFEKLTTAK